MFWTVTATFAAALTCDEVADIAVDVGGSAVYDAYAGLLGVTYDVAAATPEQAYAVAHHHLAYHVPALPVSALTIQAHPMGSRVGRLGREVNELRPGMGGRWLVATRGSHHVWDLDAMTYTRIPGPRSGSGPFSFDHQPMAISRVERWPRIGATSLLWYDDTTGPGQHEHWRQSSPITAIVSATD